MSWIDQLLAKDVLPDALIRIGIRRLLAQRLVDSDQGNVEANQVALQAFVEELKASPIAIQTKAANEQHYEVPTRFYQYCLGKRLKYSSAYFDPGVTSLDVAEERMLALTCERAELRDGQDVLELGCGWGSLTLWMAEKYPNSRITGVSNSATQREHILAQAAQRGFSNVTILTRDMNEFQIEPGFDRVVSVEMFEHMKNWEKLLEKVASWLRPGGKIFIHIFTHKDYAYHYEGKDETDWMSRYFFTGGQMPADAQMLHFQKDFVIEKHWRVSGAHYGKTSEAWLSNMDAHKAEIWPILEETYGKEQARKWWVYWRVFYMACAELWNYRGGEEWIVSHYRMAKR